MPRQRACCAGYDGLVETGLLGPRGATLARCARKARKAQKAENFGAAPATEKLVVRRAARTRQGADIAEYEAQRSASEIKRRYPEASEISVVPGEANREWSAHGIG